jgi:ribose-phosphate pyrophosphokinase
LLIFSGSSNPSLAKKIADSLNLQIGNIEIATFPDKENRVRVIDPVVGEKVVVVQSTGVSPNRYYMELFLILDSIKRSGAEFTTLVIPYLGYQRQDHIFRDGEGVSLEVIIKILESLGVSRVISFDLHSIKIPELFTVPITHLSAIPLFAREIKTMFSQLSDITLVSPDMGGIRRVEELSSLLGRGPFVSIEKNRDLTSGSIQSTQINGKVGKTAVIVDDVISTGESVIAAANLLKENGAQKVYVMATHGVFAGDASKKLQDSIIEEVIVTDSIEVRSNHKFEKLRTISISNEICESLQK